MKCPNCGSTHTVRIGVTVDESSTPAYECQDCGHRFSK